MDSLVTRAVRLLREKKVEFEPHLYDYVERGGTRHSAESLGVDEHAVVKTLVMETDAHKPLIVLMHGDREVSTKNLARHLGVKSVHPCDFAQAQKHTGYLVGGTSPFGTRIHMHVYAERTAVGKAPKGTLRNTRPDEMGAAVIEEALRSAEGVAKSELEDVIMGCA